MLITQVENNSATLMRRVIFRRFLVAASESESGISPQRQFYDIIKVELAKNHFFL